MRIEQISTTKNIPQNTNSPVLAQGDILVAEVTAVNADAVTLKSQEGFALTAKLISDMQVKVGDFVETVVDESGHGRYVLRVLNITRDSSAESAQNLADAGLVRGGINTKTLLSALMLLKMIPGADPKAAAFLSRHGLGGSPENLEILSQMTKGNETIATLLAEAAALEANASAPSNETLSMQQPMNLAQPEITAKPVVNPADAPASDAVPTQTEKSPHTAASASASENATKTGVDMIKGSAEEVQIHSGDATAIKETNAHAPQASTVSPKAPGEVQASAKKPQPVQAFAETVQPTAKPVTTHTTAPIVPDADQADAKAAVVEKNAGQPVRAEQALTAAAPMVLDGQETDKGTPYAAVKGMQSEASVPQSQSVQQAVDLLAEKLSALFVRIDDSKNLAANIKKAVDELPAQIKELKLLLSRDDTINKDMLARKLEPVEKQLEMLSQIKQFDCFHIPLQRSDQTHTAAELYVYRHRKSKAAQDESIVILLGMDTQYAGRIETILRAGSGGLSIVLHMEDMRLTDQMKDDVAQLQQAVQALGFKNVDVHLRQLVSRTTLLNAEERLNDKAAKGAGNVDIRI